MNLRLELGALHLPFREAPTGGEHPLRIGVVTDLDHHPRWTENLIEFLRQIPGIDIVPLPLAGSNSWAVEAPGWLAERVYSWSRAQFDPFGSAALDGSPDIPVSLDEIRAGGYGTIFWLADRHPGVEPRSLAKNGVFTIRLGEGNRAIPYWDEVAENRVTSEVSVFWHDSSFEQGRAVRWAETSTRQGLYVTTNAEEPLIATIRLLAGLCLEIQSESVRFEQRASLSPPQQYDWTARREYPSNFEAGLFAAKKLLRSTRLRWSARGKRQGWHIGIRPNLGESIANPASVDLSEFKAIPPPPGVEAMADPFLREAGGKQYLLFEEIAAGQSRGRIGSVEVMADGGCSEMMIVLDRPYHLSYPCVVADGGELFLLPETSGANRVELYRFTRFPWEVELVATPVEGVRLVDTTPVFVDGRWYMFTTTEEPFLETVLFSAKRLEGPWSLHPGSPVSASVRSCRSAGQLFWKDGRLFRPTQDCSLRYGYAITLKEVIKLTPDEYEERDAGYLSPHGLAGALGIHTWNESAAFQAIDVIRDVE